MPTARVKAARNDKQPFEYIITKKNITYTDKKLKLGERVVDFLPSPSELVAKNDTIKVTLELTRESVAFFKKEAKRNKAPYQRMLRRLVDEYAKRQQHP